MNTFLSVTLNYIGIAMIQLMIGLDLMILLKFTGQLYAHCVMRYGVCPV